MRPEGKWNPRLSTFLIAPALWVTLGYLIGEQVFYCWGLISVSYGAVLLAGAAAENFRLRRWLMRARATLGVLGALFWGGLLVMAYALGYLLIFHRDMFFAS
jgi:hypothetical protein